MKIKLTEGEANNKGLAGGILLKSCSAGEEQSGSVVGVDAAGATVSPESPAGADPEKLLVV